MKHDLSVTLTDASIERVDVKKCLSDSLFRETSPSFLMSL